MKALIFALMICPVIACATGCADAPYAVDSNPAKAAPAAKPRPAIALNRADAPAPIPTRKPALALNEPIIILGSADGSGPPSEVQTAAQ